MKTLQNNFTTPEQSKRLLELCVPADSADCYYEFHPLLDDTVVMVRTAFQTEDKDFFHLNKKQQYTKHYPCWSVGRLMEIYGICMGIEGFFYCKGNFINEAIRRIEYSVKKNWLDFSKLGE